MDYDVFLQEVRQRTGITSDEQAVDAARAVATTLLVCLPGTLAREVKSRLPDALCPASDSWEEEPGEPMTVSEFLMCIAEGEGYLVLTACRYAHAVLQMLVPSLGPDLLQRVRAEMPAEFDELWDASPAQSHMHQPVAA